MTEVASLPFEPPRRFHFDWVLPALFRPRRALARIAGQAGDVWLTPILIVMVAAVAHALVAGWLKQTAALSGPINLPSDFQYWSPDQQNQFMQAQAAASGPVFLYVFPSILSALSVWVGWLVVVGLLHLVFTLLGARGSTRAAMNLVAWAGLPFAVRDLVRIGYMLAARQLVGHPGLSGFAPADAGAVSLFLAELLRPFDLYLMWHILLLVLGVRVAETLPAPKAWGGVLITMGIVLLLQALPGFAMAQFSGLNIIRPFFF
jgi:Yip1-like protein